VSHATLLYGARLPRLRVHGTCGRRCLLVVSTTDSLRDALATCPPGATICIQPACMRGLRRDAGRYATRNRAPRPVRLTLPEGGAARCSPVLRRQRASASRPGKPDGHPRHGDRSLASRSAWPRDRDQPERLGRHAARRLLGERRGRHLPCDGSTLAAYDCEFEANQFGAYLDAGASAQFYECRFSSNTYGLVAGKGVQVLLRECSLDRSSEIGARFSARKRPSITAPSETTDGGSSWAETRGRPRSSAWMTARFWAVEKSDSP